MLKDKESVLLHLESSSMSFVRKRKRNMIVFFFRQVVGGMYYSAVIPSLWLYLQKFNSGKLWYGMVVAMYQLAAVLLLPFVGRLYDKTKRTKAILTLLNLAEFTGALIYCLPFSSWFPLIGRFISGMGGAHGGVVNGEIAMTTPNKGRVSRYALVDMAYMVGMLFGPSFAVLFRKVNFTIGKLRVDFANAPGMMGVVLWLLVEACNRVMTSNVALDYVVATLETPDTLTKNRRTINEDETENERLQDAITVDSDTEENLLVRPSIQLPPNKFTASYLLRIIYPSDMLSILMVYLGTTIGIVSMDVIIPLVTQIDFGWSTLGTSTTFLVAAAVIAVMYGFVYVVGKKLSEICCLCISIVLFNLGALILIPFRDVSSNMSVKVLMFSAAIGLGCIALPLCQVSSKSILSKVVATEFQGYIQSVLSVVLRSGSIIAPIFGSFAFEHLYLGFGYLVVVNILVGLWFFASLDLLKMRMSFYQKQQNIDL